MKKRKLASFLYKLFNYDKIDKQQETIDIYAERIDQLDAELREYKGYKLKYEVAKMYVEDDEALLELFELAKKAKDQEQRVRDQQEGLMRASLASQQSAAFGMMGAGISNQGLLGQLGGLVDGRNRFL